MALNWRVSKWHKSIIVTVFQVLSGNGNSQPKSQLLLGAVLLKDVCSLTERCVVCVLCFKEPAKRP